MKPNPVIGNIDIKTDPQGIKATLHFTPAEGGKEWTLEALRTLLEKREITHGYTSQSLGNVLQQLGSAADKDHSAVVAEATPSQNGEEETPEWKDCPIPPALEEDALTFFAQVQKPQIYITQYEEVKVKQAKTTKRFLFLPKKQEVKVSKKKKIRVPIGVDPRVLGKGWVEQGTLLATMLPKTAGKEGTDIFGRPIPAEQLGKPLHLGSGVERKGNKIEATVGGFFRRGEDWVEALPFQPHKWEISLSKDQNTFFLSFQPGEKYAAPPSPETILKEAKDRGAPEESLLSAYELGTILQGSIDAKKALSEVPISSGVDGSFTMRVSEDKLKVFLFMKKSRGQGKPLVLKDFGKALKDANYLKANYAKIQEDVLAFYRGSEKELTDYLLAEGIPPEPPGEVSVRVILSYLSDDEVKTIKDREKKHSSNPHWLAQTAKEVPSLEKHPLSQVDRMAMATKGAVIAEISWKPGKPGKDVFGNAIPSGEGENTGIHIFEGLEKKGKQIVTTKEGMVDQWGNSTNPNLRVRPHRDCFIGITLAANRMKAFLSLRSGAGTGEILTLERVEQAYKERGILRGLNEEVLAQAVKQAIEGQEIDNLAFANGRPPSGESSGNPEILVDLKPNGTAHSQNLNQLTMVKGGDPLVKISRNTQGSQEGWDVTGRSIPPTKKSIPPKITPGENVREETDEAGNILFYADKSGKLIYENDRVSIVATHIVTGNVDKASGSIKFPGSVKVTGRVQPGYYVMAEGDIYIENTVKAALVSAGGSVHIKKEILGEDKGVIRARHTINATFVEGCTLFAVGDIILSRDCINCNVNTNERLVLQGAKSVLLGGRIHVRRGLETFNLGSDKKVLTAVSFGQDYLIQNRIGAEEREIQKAKGILAEIDVKLKQATKQGASAGISGLHAEKRKQMKLIEKKSMRALMLREKFEEHYPGEIRVRGTVYPGVILEAHGRTLEVDRERKNITFHFDEKTGRITIKENK